MTHAEAVVIAEAIAKLPEKASQGRESAHPPMH